MKYVIFDTETSGLPARKGWDTYHNPAQYDKYYSNSRMIELGYILYEDGKEIKRYESLVIPDNYEINNSHIHGITTDKANADGRPIQDVLTQFESDLVGVDMIVGHNVLFDKNIVLAEAYRYGRHNLVRLMDIKYACTMGLGKTHMNSYKSPKLIELYAYLFGGSLVQTHRALSDAIATAECFHYMVF
jgi:DNA polymerase-3 subunit alpha